MSRKKAVTVFTLICLLGLYAFSRINDSNQGFDYTIEDTLHRDTLPSATGNGVHLGLYSFDGDIEENLNISLEENEEIIKFLSIGHMNDFEREYMVLMFIDFEQRSFSVDGESPVESFTFQMKPHTAIQIPVTIPKLSSGRHELLFVIVKEPNNMSLDEEIRKKTELSHLLFLRKSLVVQQDSNESITYSDYPQKESNSLDGIFINRDAEDFNRWLTETISYDDVKKENYYLHIGNNSNLEHKEYAVIMLSNWKQVPINGKEKQYIRVPNHSYVTIKDLLPISLHKGVNNLTPILVHNPYSELSYSECDVETTTRVGVVVD